MTEAPLSDCC